MNASKPEETGEMGETKLHGKRAPTPPMNRIDPKEVAASQEFWRPLSAWRPGDLLYLSAEIVRFRLACREDEGSPLVKGVHCRLYRGVVNPKGYGLRRPEWRGEQSPMKAGQPVHTHREAWEMFHNQVLPNGWHVHHLCRNRLCVEPLHLEAMPEEHHRDVHRQPRNKSARHKATGDSEIQAVLLRWQMGQSVGEIAAERNLAPSNVRHLLRTYGQSEVAESSETP